MTSEEKEELLDRYVTGQPMNAEEEALVDQLLATDSEFRSEFRLRHELFELGKRERRTAWEARQTLSPLPGVRTIFPMRWAAAASIILLLGIGLVWWLRTADNQPLTGQVALFEKRDAQLGLAVSDSAAVGKVSWVITKSSEDQYEFSQLNQLQIFAAKPDEWKDTPWQLMRLSEVRYQLRVGKRTYQLEQGRQMRLPLKPDQ